MRLRRQAGEGIMGCIVWLVILAAVALVLIKMLPVKIADAELADFMVEQAKFAGRGTTAAGVHQALYEKAVSLNLPVNKKDIEVRLTGGRIVMKCSYSVPIDLVVYTYVWHFKHEENRPIFIV